MTHPGDNPNWKPSNLRELLTEVERRARKFGVNWVHYLCVDGRLYERTPEGLVEAKAPEGEGT